LKGGRMLVGEGAPPASANVIRIGRGGELHNAGIIEGRIELPAGGRHVPGNSPGRSRIEGDYLQESGSTLEMTIAGTEAITTHSVLEVTGAASLSGTLVLNFIEGFAPKTGDVFDLLRLSEN